MNSLSIRRQWHQETKRRELKSPAIKRRCEARRRIEEIKEKKQLEKEFELCI